VIILIMFVKKYKLWSSSLCSFLQSPVTSSLFGQCPSYPTLYFTTFTCMKLHVNKIWMFNLLAKINILQQMLWINLKCFLWNKSNYFYVGTF
jgi:hypothetical protein